jgi:hypothetical protein
MLDRLRLEEPVNVEDFKSLPQAVAWAIGTYGYQATPLGPGFHDLTPQDTNYDIQDRAGIVVLDDDNAVSRLITHEDSGLLSVDLSTGDDTERTAMRIPQDCDGIVVISFTRANIHRKAGRLCLFNVVYPHDGQLHSPLQQLLLGTDTTEADMLRLHKWSNPHDY